MSDLGDRRAGAVRLFGGQGSSSCSARENKLFTDIVGTIVVAAFSAVYLPLAYFLRPLFLVGHSRAGDGGGGFFCDGVDVYAHDSALRCIHCGRRSARPAAPDGLRLAGGSLFCCRASGSATKPNRSRIPLFDVSRSMYTVDDLPVAGARTAPSLPTRQGQDLGYLTAKMSPKRAKGRRRSWTMRRADDRLSVRPDA